MATPFAFVPRAVFKYTKEWQGISRPPPSPSPPPDPTTDSEPEDDEDDRSNTTPDKVKGKEKAIESVHSKQSNIALDIASLISLALSDYNIWLDADLRWKLNACLGDETSPDEVGFVPINYLLRRTPFRSSLPLASGQPDPSETEVVRALRTHASHTLEVRMRLASSSSASAPPASVWYGTGKTSRKKDVGGYEVRRRDWSTLRDRLSCGWSRARWDDMTAYMECIPPQYRTVGGIARFAETLLSLSSGPETDTDMEPCLRVQCVTLPPHYLDKPGDMPKCKGYALITFSTKSHVEAVLRAWPWRRRRVLGPAHTDASPIAREAHKYGLRMISKARWDVLNGEYLLYKQYLVDEMARTQVQIHHTGEDATEHERDEPTALPHPNPETETEAETQTTPSSPYPFGCLVFVRNVHPDTNKTTLKSLFAQAFQDGSSLDYVDFNRGMDTCYLRLASPHHVTRLIEYFGCDARRKAQVHGLDATGRTPVQDDKPIAMERIQGKKEELYWEKVPEKVRRQAVNKVIKTQLAPGTESSASPTTNGQQKRTREP
ncbi:hypothetical protein J3R82DRAFT_4644 [Butyriboletus roseoflavus]|nr:hypothetical protein J3R82DRAFT_4644 [Butyriboletus roseoflavus]